MSVNDESFFVAILAQDQEEGGWDAPFCVPRNCSMPREHSLSPQLLQDIRALNRAQLFLLQRELVLEIEYRWDLERTLAVANRSLARPPPGPPGSFRERSRSRSRSR